MNIQSKLFHWSIPYHQWSDVDKTRYRSIGFLTAVSDRKARGREKCSDGGKVITMERERERERQRER